MHASAGGLWAGLREQKPSLGPFAGKAPETPGQAAKVRPAWLGGPGLSARGFRLVAFGSRISDFGFRISDFGFRISDFGLRISDCGFRIADFGFQRGWARASPQQAGCAFPANRLQAARVPSAPHPGFRSRPRPGNRLDFAPALIAAKPLKPCDGGVFRGSFFAPVFEVKLEQCVRPLAGFGRFAGTETKPWACCGKGPGNARPICESPSLVVGRAGTFGFRLSAFGFRLSAFGFRLAACGLRFAACGLRLAVCGLRRGWARASPQQAGGAFPANRLQAARVPSATVRAALRSTAEPTHRKPP